MPPATARFAARPVAVVVDELADALAWPRSRPARVLNGDRATSIGRVVLCVDEDALAALDAPHDAAAVLCQPPTSTDGRLGRRAYDPVAGSPEDVASWRRVQRVVLDAALLLAGGRGGFDERVAQLAGVEPLAGHRDLAALRSIPRDVCKLVAYVPVDAAEVVRTAVFAAGAGTIGGYDMCSWSVRGVGTFRGGEGTNPAVGQRGVLEQVDEERFEVVVPRHLVDRVVRAYVAAHPYEEPAYDVLELAIPAQTGFGRLGRLGSGGGGAAWTALGGIDAELEAHGRVDSVPAGATCAVHAGALQDVLDAVLAVDDLGLCIVASATDAELELLAARDVAVLIPRRGAVVDAHAAHLAGALSRTLRLPVTVAGALRFPDSATAAAPAAASVAVPNDGTWRLHFDGGSRGNPGPAAYGWVLYDPDGNEADSDGVQLGSTTNNVAEWTGLLKGLEHALARGITALDVRGDSELVVKQVNGQYKVKNAALKPLAEQVAQLLERFEHVDVQHVYRSDNARADAVANEALDGLR